MEQSNAVGHQPAAIAVKDGDDFRKFLNVATLILVAIIAVMTAIDLLSSSRPQPAAQAPAQPDRDYVALDQSINATRESVVRLEQQVTALASAPAPAAPVARPTRRRATTNASYAALSRSIAETRDSIARIEQKVDALATPPAEPVIAPTPVAEIAPTRPACMRISLAGRSRWHCDRSMLPASDGPISLVRVRR